MPIHRWRGLAEWIQSLDTGGLKRLGVITYFGVYALLFVVHRPVNWIVSTSVDPVWMVLDLPQSVAMALISLSATVLVVSVVVARDAYRTVNRDVPSDHEALGSSAAPRESVPAGGWGETQRVSGNRGSSTREFATPTEQAGPPWERPESDSKFGRQADSTSDPTPHPGTNAEGRTKLDSTMTAETGAKADQGAMFESRTDELEQAEGSDEDEKEEWPEGWISAEEL